MRGEPFLNRLFISKWYQSIPNLIGISCMSFITSATNRSSRGGSPGPSDANPRPPSPLVATPGSVGEGRLFRNFRVMFINGCSYEEWESIAAAQKISQLFQERIGQSVKVHYTYIPMNFKQVIHSVRWNIDPPGNDILLQSIRERLQHISKPPSQKPSRFGELEGGRLALVLHSGAGAYLKSIMRRLTPEERKKIDVITLGSACLFKKEDFHNAMNYIAHWDPFPRLAQFAESFWPRRYNAEVLSAGSVLQAPVLSHKFFRFPYQDALKKVVDMYLEEARRSAGPEPLPVT